MPRQRRIYIPGLPVHVTVRGNDRQAIFRSDVDRLCFLECLRDAMSRHELVVHAYVLMTNHVHLLATPAHERSLPRTIQSIGRSYVPRFNRLYARTGGLWEGRHHAILIDTDRWALLTQRYIELNPVRAKMVGHPAAHIWSSYLHHAFEKPDDLVQSHAVYLTLASDGDRRRERYRGLCEAGVADEDLEAIRRAMRSGRPLGSEELQLQVEALGGPRVVRAKRGRPCYRLPLLSPRELAFAA